MNVTYTLAKLLENEMKLMRVKEFPIITNNITEITNNITEIEPYNKKKFPGIQNINYEELIIELTATILKSNKVYLLSGYLTEIYDFIPHKDLEELIKILHELDPKLAEAEAKAIQSFVDQYFRIL